MPLSTRCAVLLLSVAVPLTRAPAQSNIQPRDTGMVNRSTNPLLANFRFRSIGPASMGGRIDDLAVYERDPRIIYIGYAAGGVFKSTNAGTTFAPIFEEYGSASIGDLAVDQSNPDVLYVGTGEPNNRQTSTFGDGLYKSTDGGQSFQHMGLRETQTIARIVIDPRNSNTVYVASLGHLFGPNPERGVYKTTDGGTTWAQIKYIDEHTGFTDLVMDPDNSKVLYAASYQRRRTGCCFNGGGPGSALWKTVDGGATWTKLTTGGLPPGTYGRIAVDVARSNGQVVYAQIETDGADSAATFASAPPQRGGYDWCSNAGPNQGFPAAPAGSGADDDTEADADTARTPPPLSRHRPGLYRSSDRGENWTLVSNCNGRPMYFSNIRVDPTNEDAIYLSNVRGTKSLDGGRTFLPIDRGLGNGNETVDQHAFWIDPANPDHILRGSDAGLAITWDQGETWEYVRTMATGLAYWVTADNARPYNVLAGLQDNDTWRGPGALRSSNGIRNHNWFRYGGGDGFQTAVDPTNTLLVFSEAQNGRTQRRDLRSGEATSIRPVPPPAPSDAPKPVPGTCVDGSLVPADTATGAARGGGGGAATSNVIGGVPGEEYRFNWNTPYMLSPHNPNVLWLGGNRLFRSSDQGDLWTASADLTRNVNRCDVRVMGARVSEPLVSKNDGVTSYSTITAVSESPVLAGVVWAGTDDGNLQVSRDHGATFTEVGQNIRGLPTGALRGDHAYWMSRIETSHFDAATAYIAVDGHRSDDLRPYIFVTRDYGATWTNVAGNLPARGNVQVIREDPRNPQLLYVGTEFGLYLSMNGGASWERFMNNYPTVRTDDIFVHPRDGDLIVASHGRSLWIADDITPLQQWTPAVAAADATLFDVRPAVAYLTDTRLDVYTGGEKEFEGENPARGTAIQFHLRQAAEATIRISTAAGRAVCETTVQASAGINRVQWTLVTPLLSASARGGGAAGGGARANAAGGAARDSAARGTTPPARATTPPRNAGCEPPTTGRRGGGGASAASGSYLVTLVVGGKEYVKPVQVLEDRWMLQP